MRAERRGIKIETKASDNCMLTSEVEIRKQLS